MIGIQQLDNLTTEQMIDVIEGRLNVAVRDPRKIQLVVEDVKIADLPEPPNPYFFMDHSTVITLLKMELESRAGWAYVADKIKEAKQ